MFQWEYGHFALAQQAELEFYSSISLKQLLSQPVFVIIP
jgi:hypothetical protein